MTSYARRVASVPRRLPDETWERICELVCRDDDPARDELRSVTGIVALLICEEYSAAEPIVFSGGGPQIRFYTLHNDDALEADLEDEIAVALPLSEGDWHVSLPAKSPDIAWAERELATKSTRITVRDVAA